jgi:hypothetical protein
MIPGRMEEAVGRRGDGDEGGMQDDDDDSGGFGVGIHLRSPRGLVGVLLLLELAPAGFVSPCLMISVQRTFGSHPIASLEAVVAPGILLMRVLAASVALPFPGCVPRGLRALMMLS